MAMKFKDKKDVYFLFTLHRPKLVDTKKKDRAGDNILKEITVVDYNHNMGFVDKNDSIIKPHSMVRKSQKWTIKVAYHMIEEANFQRPCSLHIF